MTLFNIISCALISAAIGGRFGNHPIFKPRTIAIGAFIGLLIPYEYQNIDYGYIIAWLYAFTIIRLLPTGGMFQAISNERPKLNGSKLEKFIYWLTISHWTVLPNRLSTYRTWGIIYGFVRTLPVIPAAYYLNAPLLYLMPFIGVIYYACGKVFCGRTGDVLKDNTRAVIAAEIVTLGIMGASL